MQRETYSRNKNAQNTFETELNTLCKLSNLSPIVQEILKSWITIQKSAARRNYHSEKRFPVFRVLKENDILFLQKMRNQFVEHFENDPEFLEATAYSPSRSFDRTVLHSIRLYGASKGHYLMFPLHIFNEVRLGNPERLLQTIIENLTRFSHYRALPNFIDLFRVACERIPVRRTDLAVRYFQTLVDLGFVTALHQTVTDTDLAVELNCSREAAYQIHNAYKHLGAVHPQYLVNMAKLGFHCFRVVHQDPLPAEFQLFTLRTYILCRNSYISILWLPAVSDLLAQIPSKQTAEINQYLISRDFSQLHRTIEKSWRTPNRLLEETDPIIPPRRGIWFPLMANPNPQARPLIDFSLMDQLQLGTSNVYVKLAESFQVSEKYVRERLEALLQEAIIAPFYFISRIGLNVNMLIAFEGPEEDTKALRNDLLSFPYAEMFSGPNGGHVLLKIPEFWTPTVLEDVMRLRRKGLEIWAVYSAPITSRWGIPLAEIVQKDEFFGIWWQAE